VLVLTGHGAKTTETLPPRPAQAALDGSLVGFESWWASRS
jgi:hypothetical protein